MEKLRLHWYLASLLGVVSLRDTGLLCSFKETVRNRRGFRMSPEGHPLVKKSGCWAEFSPLVFKLPRPSHRVSEVRPHPLTEWVRGWSKNQLGVGGFCSPPPARFPHTQQDQSSLVRLHADPPPRSICDSFLAVHTSSLCPLLSQERLVVRKWVASAEIKSPSEITGPLGKTRIATPG